MYPPGGHPGETLPLFHPLVYMQNLFSWATLLEESAVAAVENILLEVMRRVVSKDDAIVRK